MFTRYKLVIASIVVVLLSACGSGGGGGAGSSTSAPASTPTDANLAFQIFPAGAFSSGYTETYQLSGSDTVGGTYTATLSATTQPQTTFNGQPAIPVQSLVKITNNQTGAFVTGTSIGYYSTDSGSRMYLGFTDNTTNTTYTAVSLNVIPQSAKIGDSGVVGTYSGGGETDQISWQLTNANNGLANLVTNNTTTISGNLQWSGEHSYVIDQSGNRKSLTIKIFYADSGITVTLSGNKQ
jgi:hypothetical protein